MLAGISPNHQLYVDMIYDLDDKLARYMLGLDGSITILADEGDETKPAEAPLPPDLISPQRIEHNSRLNFSIGRFRGMREEERIADLLTPPSIYEKMALVQALNLPILPPMLLGVAESAVLAMALLESPDTYLVCRRVRLAYTLTRPQLDESRQQYDYDTVTLHLAHSYNLHSDNDTSLVDLLGAQPVLLPGAALHSPMDVMVYDDNVIVADGGNSQHPAAVHIWTRNKSTHDTE
ncbi:MAG: hypothetical protein U0694_11850 [Anaerolineae bacterium]